MIIHPAVVEAAESRKPPEIDTTVAPEQGLAAEAFVIAPAAPGENDPSLRNRVSNLKLGGATPSATEMERLIGTNDLVDEFYLQRALVAAQPVMRITLRDPANRERGWATGFMVSPRLLLTNWHVFPTLEETANAIAEAHYVLDIAGNPAPSYRFAVRGDRFYISDEALDFSLVAVDQMALDGTTPLSQFGYHRLIAEPNKIREGESITLIQHPGGERRQFAIRDNQLKEIQEQFLWYLSDTSPGSSGAPAFNDSFQVVALHHSGAAKKDDQGRYVLRDGTVVASLAGIDDSRVDWVANEGLRISVLCAFLTGNLPPDNAFVDELIQAMQGGDVIANSFKGISSGAPEIRSMPAAPSNGVITVPLQLQISLSTGGAQDGRAAVVTPGASPVTARLPAEPIGVEKFVSPIVNRDYSGRTGYDVNFLGVPAPLPTDLDLNRLAKLEDGSPLIPYEHFTIALDKLRRLPLFTAANLDYAAAKRKPENGRDYTRAGLTGLGKFDIEKWFTDPRVPGQSQLPDVFYTKDGGLFDKGHVVMREAMCWGDTYDQIRRANGDTYHVTNCTPQVLGFNRSTKGEDNWGDLENEINKQAKAEKLSVLGGPILADDDGKIEGRDDFGEIHIQIPRRFWKVVLANDNGQLAAYAFVLEQDVSRLPVEFQVKPEWKKALLSIPALEALISGFKFSPAIHAADRAGTDGPELAHNLGA